MGIVNNFKQKIKKRFLKKVVYDRYGEIVVFQGLQRPIIDIIRGVRKGRRMLLSDAEAYIIYSLVAKTERVPGDIAELGVFLGGSAKLITLASTKRSIHLFDTFSGLPALGEHDSQKFFKGEFPSSLASVKEFINNDRVNYYEGIFPGTITPDLKNKKFSFVHLDADLYEPTNAALHFFYPRLSRGAVVVAHDYNSSKGVRKAFDEFFADKPEIIIEGNGEAIFIKT